MQDDNAADLIKKGFEEKDENLYIAKLLLLVAQEYYAFLNGISKTQLIPEDSFFIGYISNYDDLLKKLLGSFKFELVKAEYEQLEIKRGAVEDTEALIDLSSLENPTKIGFQSVLKQTQALLADNPKFGPEILRTDLLSELSMLGSHLGDSELNIFKQITDFIKDSHLYTDNLSTKSKEIFAEPDINKTSCEKGYLTQSDDIAIGTDFALRMNKKERFLFVKRNKSGGFLGKKKLSPTDAWVIYFLNFNRPKAKNAFTRKELLDQAPDAKNINSISNVRLKIRKICEVYNVEELIHKDENQQWMINPNI